MQKIIIILNTSNAAFDTEPGAEAARILREFADSLEGLETPPDEIIKLKDINGNTTGTAEIQ